MILGCKEHYEPLCPDFPEKCPACGWFIDKRKKVDYYVLTNFLGYDIFCFEGSIDFSLTDIKFIGGFTMSKGECFVANAFVGVSKKTGREFYAVNVVIPDGDKYDVQMGFANKDVVDYVNKAGAGIYKYSIGFGGRIDGLEFVRKANL